MALFSFVSVISCQDLDPQCSDYAKHCRYANVKERCPLTCKQCGTLLATALYLNIPKISPGLIFGPWAYICPKAFCGKVIFSGEGLILLGGGLLLEGILRFKMGWA